MMRWAAMMLVLAIAAGASADARTRAHMRSSASAPSHWDVTAQQRIDDLDWLVDQLKAKYAYRDKKKIDLDQIKTIYRDAAAKAATPADWLAVLERVMAELYDHHATLGRNTASSPQLIPSGTDVWAELVSGKPTIIQVRPASVAARAGLRPGLTIQSINGRAVDRVIDDGVPQSMAMPDPEAGAYALRVALAGTHIARRTIVACSAAGCRTYAMGPVGVSQSAALVTWRKVSGDIGVIRIDNSLGDTGTVRQFDAALEQLESAKGLILDLRDTPSGGDTDVAEPILARFIKNAAGYQRVFEPGPNRSFPQDSWVKDIDARPPFVKQPLVVLVDHWTGSMGEGLAVGLDAVAHATVVGTKMAGLLGGTGDFTLPHSGVPVHFPIERLYHVNGTPREEFKPAIWFEPTDPNGPDAIFNAGVDALKAKMGEE